MRSDGLKPAELRNAAASMLNSVLASKIFEAKFEKRGYSADTCA